MQQNSNQRIVYLDLLRILATFAVIFLHGATSEFYNSHSSINWYMAAVEDSLVRWCVPVFVMISGALFLNPNKEISYRVILTKRIPRLLLAYVFWALAYVMYGFIRWDMVHFSILHLIRRSIVIPAAHLWFLPLLMVIYLLIPVLRKIAQDNKLTNYVLVIWIVFVCFSFLRFVRFFKMATHFYWIFDGNTILGFSGYFLLGYFLSQHVFSKRAKACIYLLGIVGALFTIIGTIYLYASTGEVSELYFDNLSLQVVAMAIALFVLMKELASRCGKKALKAVDYVRKDLFGIYLIHALWLEIVDIDVIRHCCSEIIALPMITFIVFLLSLFTIKLIRLVPGLRKVVE